MEKRARVFWRWRIFLDGWLKPTGPPKPHPGSGREIERGDKGKARPDFLALADLS
jgi:hypothetical protein